MNGSATLGWFVRHELRLAWRDWLAMITAGRRRRTRGLVIGLVIFAALMHLLALAVVGRYADAVRAPDRTAFIVITASLFLAWALMLSQAIESVTRVFYGRADLDLIASSPASLRSLLSIRMGAIALTVTAMAMLIASPFVNVLALGGGAWWLTAYLVVAAGGMSAAAVAMLVTLVLFRMIGPRRTRLVAQIVAVIIGAGFVIALQVAAILSYGTLSRFAVLTSDTAAAFAPGADSLIWWPVRAVLGDRAALFAILAASMLLLGVTMAVMSPRLGDDVVRASTDPAAALAKRGRARPFRNVSRQGALRHKEFLLLWRDPWLISQTLMQLLYLLPPALMLWRSFAEHSNAGALIAPVLVMASGQLAGGLAWLTVSGEDAADLVATAPLPAERVTRAKLEVVLIAISAVFAPLLLPLAWLSPEQAVVTLTGVAIAAAASTAIQLWFRTQARRSQFRRRQTSSRFATFAEAFSSIGWAATAALALTLPWIALITALMSAAILALTWRLSPARHMAMDAAR